MPLLCGPGHLHPVPVEQGGFVEVGGILHVVQQLVDETGSGLGTARLSPAMKGHLLLGDGSIHLPANNIKCLLYYMCQDMII